MRVRRTAFRGDSSRPRIFGRHRFGPAALLAVLLAMVVAVPIASAATVISERNPTIAAGRTFDDDVYLFGNDVQFDGQATRDVNVAGADITFGTSSRVSGNVNVAGNEVQLSGTVERSVRAAGRVVTISGTINGDVVVAARTVRIQKGTRIRGDMLVQAQNTTIAGTIDGDLRGHSNALTLTNGQVSGAINLGGDSLHINGTSRVLGTIRYQSGNDPDIANTAAVSGTIQRVDPTTVSSGDYAIPAGYVWKLYRLVALLVAGLILVLVIPTGIAAAADGVRRRLPITLILGVVALILIPIAALFLLATVIGIPVAVALLAAYAVVLYLSQVVVGIALGRWLLPTGWRSYGRGFNILAMTIGVIIIGLVRLIPYGPIDTIVALVVAILGIGAIFTATRNDGRRLRVPATATGAGRGATLNAFGGYDAPRQQ